MTSTCKYQCKKGKVLLEGVGLVDCPECRDFTKVISEVDSDGKSKLDKLLIPNQYKMLGTAGRELFTADVVKAFSPTSVNEVINFMERVNEDIYTKSKVPLVSTYIKATNLIDVYRFVYGAMTSALERGMGVSPFISANTLYGLQKAGDFPIWTLDETKNKVEGLKNVSPDLIMAIDGYRLMQDTDLTYYDFITSDVCFIEATANTTDKGWTGVADLLRERTKKGLPTYVIGYWDSRSMEARTLRYILANEGSMTRLDLLVPFELRTDKSKGTEMARVLPTESVKSSVTAGLSLENFMNGG